VTLNLWLSAKHRQPLFFPGEHRKRRAPAGFRVHLAVLLLQFLDQLLPPEELFPDAPPEGSLRWPHARGQLLEIGVGHNLLPQLEALVQEIGVEIRQLSLFGLQEVHGLFQAAGGADMGSLALGQLFQGLQLMGLGDVSQVLHHLPVQLRVFAGTPG
jgi:hypothetical protein